jgi:NAD(P)-dependent dehydrogenase (short-subunit alcohol dehydrogenase family)
LNENTAAIVSGHSRGFGEAIANELLQRGIRVLGISRRANPTLAQEHGDRLSEVQLDLADADALRAWLSSDALQVFLSTAEVALLVNNAGILQPLGPLETQDAGTILTAAAVNVGAALALSASFVQKTSAAKDRRILHISSGAGRHVYAGWSVYCASKAALDHHARAVAVDSTPRLRISAVAPGVIDTDMQAEIRASSDELVPDRPRFVEMKREGALVAPEAAARGVVDFLLSNSFGSEPVSALR